MFFSTNLFKEYVDHFVERNIDLIKKKKIRENLMKRYETFRFDIPNRLSKIHKARKISHPFPSHLNRLARL